MPYTEIVLNRTYPGQACSIARALEIVGERWTLLILRDSYRGTRRFDDLHASLERFEDHPTAKGRELWPVLMHLMLWGDRYYSAPDGPPQTAEHDGCGGRLTAELTCDRCGRRLGPGDVLLRPRHKAARAHGEAEPFSV